MAKNVTKGVVAAVTPVQPQAPVYQNTAGMAPVYQQPAAYQSQYQSAISGLLDKVTNRGTFKYNPLQDANYQNLAKVYDANGTKAMRDTLGQAAGLNGGYNTSWATSAAAQAKNDYNQQLAALIPELEQNAYQRWADNFNMNLSALGALQTADDSLYGRYRDAVADSQWQYSQDYGRYRDNVTDSQWKYSQDYNLYRDQIGDNQWNQNFEYQRQRDSVADRQWSKDFNLRKSQASSSGGRRSGGGSGGYRGTTGGGNDKAPTPKATSTQNNPSGQNIVNPTGAKGSSLSDTLARMEKKRKSKGKLFDNV